MMKECRLINRCGLIGVLLFFCVTMHAQQFSVGSFRLLPNDITAYIAPVKDLNNEACALIKVVGDADFVFSTPLEIVQRKEEVGKSGFMCLMKLCKLPSSILNGESCVIFILMRLWNLE